MTSLHSPLLLCAALFALQNFALGIASSAKAQANARVLVVPYGPADVQAPDHELIATIRLALVEAGAHTVSLHEARDRVLAQNRPPRTTLDSEEHDIRAETQRAIEHAAFGRNAAARQSAERALRLTERALESLHRATDHARTALDACLVLVRETLSRGDRQRAVAEASRCRALVPDLAPDESLHPVAVVGALAEADGQIRRSRTGPLIVRSAPQQTCSVYVNGRHLGITPLRLDRLAPGTYRVQIECGDEASRIHTIELGDRVELAIDMDLDRALLTEGTLRLSYAERHVRFQALQAHAAVLAEMCDADETMLVGIGAEDRRLLRVSRRGDLMGNAALAVGLLSSKREPSIRSAVLRALEGRFDEHVFATDDGRKPTASSAGKFAQPSTAGEPIPSAAANAAARSHANDADEAPGKPRDAQIGSVRKRALRRAGASLAAAGVGTVAASIAAQIVAAQADDAYYRLNRDPLPDADAIRREAQRYDLATSWGWVGAAAGPLFMAALPLLAESRRDRGSVPWWAYTLGGVGAAGIVWGTLELRRDGECISYVDARCYRARDSKVVGALLLSVNIPAAMLPFELLVSRWARSRRTPPSHHTEGRGLRAPAEVHGAPGD